MGCGTSAQKIDVIEPFIKAILCPKGILTVSVMDAHLQHDTAIMMKMDPYAQVRLDKKMFQTKVMKNAGKEPAFNEVFNFFINSDHISEGRKLQMTVWDSNKTIDEEVGFGIADVDPIIFNKLVDIQQKCYINYKRAPAGYVNIKLSFKEQFMGILIVKIMSASIRRKTSTLSDMKCVARLTIGEAIQQTDVSKDTKESPPIWKDTFKMSVIASSMTAKLQVFDLGIGGQTLVGDCELDMNEIMTSPPGKQFNPEIFFKQANAGNVKFITSFVNLEKVLLENRKSAVEEKERELAEKEKIIADRDRELLLKSRIKQAEKKDDQKKDDKDAKDKENKDQKDQPDKKDSKQPEKKDTKDSARKDQEAQPPKVADKQLPAPRP